MTYIVLKLHCCCANCKRKVRLIVIVEGPDGAGKTTLVNELCDQFGLVPGERATANRKLLYTVTRQDTYTALSEAVKGTTPVRVWDRLYYSELVYAELVGRPIEFKSSEREFIQEVIAGLSCPIIVCLPDYPIVEENARKADQMAGVNEHLVEIYNAYVKLYDTNAFGEALVYDYTKPAGNSHDRGPYRFRFASRWMVFKTVEVYLNRRHGREWNHA